MPMGGNAVRNIVVLLFEQASILTLTGVLEPFGLVGEVDKPDASDAYAIWLVSRHGGQVGTLIGHSIDTLPIDDIDTLSIDTLMISGGFGTQQAIHDETLIDWVARRAPGIRRICTLGTGVWIAAEAGLLEDRRVVVHWRLIEDFTRRYPAIRSEASSLFLRDGPIWSSPGLAGAIDLSLALIEEDLGRGCALLLARLLVVYMKRPAGQPQLSAALCSQAEGSDRFDTLHTWILANLHRDLSVEQLAEAAHMSVRNFTRVYQASTGMTPAKAVEAMRLEAACGALQDTDARISEIAQSHGFGDEERMRRAFLRSFGLGPTAWRHQRRRELATEAEAAPGRWAIRGPKPDSLLRLKPFRQRAQALLQAEDRPLP
jgi:transcriptional regulator GlxA family with amidase domain